MQLDNEYLQKHTANIIRNAEKLEIFLLSQVQGKKGYYHHSSISYLKFQLMKQDNKRNKLTHIGKEHTTILIDR